MASSRYELDLNLTSAKSLKNVNWRHGANQPYAVVWVDQVNKFTTNVDPNGDTEAEWNQPLILPLPPKPFEDLTLYIDVVHAGFEEDTKKLIGSARLQLVDVLEVGIGERVNRTLTLKRPSGRPQGKVDVKVGVREIGYHAHGANYPPPYGVPPPESNSRDYSSASSVYGYPYGAPPPPQQQGSYYPTAPYPQTASYGSQTVSYGQGGNYVSQTTAYEQEGNYGETASYVKVEEKKKSKFGGMGTGLAVGAVAGVLGGIALVEGAEYVEDRIADDVAERIEDDLGYDDDF
ncbi:unnamed protein product [Lathyrus oleraceus]|uniref:C2 domain-containing protein n=1 Tax=Pisum sativum TaxID=3888 RepID=A0A9D5BID6_PEA|nr:uncharacterized protein LOC127128434 [Pisum sativum]KAI5444190.1 hypothetical protein KIW84_012713 [Pisum sativum]